MLLHRFRETPCCFDRLVRDEVEIQKVNLLPLLSRFANTGISRAYFSRRDQSLSIAGLGRAGVLQADSPEATEKLFDQLQARQGDQAAATWIGGCSFSGENGSEHWQDFPAALFVLPLVELVETETSLQLAVNFQASTIVDWQQQLAQLTVIVALLSSRTHNTFVAHNQYIQGRQQSCDYNRWRQMVDQTLTGIAEGTMAKSVLAREVCLQMQGAVDPFETLANIDRTHNRSYLFAIENRGSLFFGCSPERLFRRRGMMLETEAVAGTVARGKSSREDLNLEKSLTSNRKLVLEHRLVADAIESALRPLSSHVSRRPDVGVVKLAHVQHGFQPIQAVLRAEVGDSSVFRQLHPTPAVCGFPREQARAFIDKREGFQRGWYAGAVGIVSSDHTELAVAIRSGLCQHNRLWLYSGVGLVEGSSAREEWQELESKLELMLQALGASELQVC